MNHSSVVSFSGIASGIDSASLIDALIQRERTSRITPLQNQISSRTDTISSLDKLKGLLGKLRTAADAFRSLGGGAVNHVASSSDETVLTGTAAADAANGSYSVTVSQLAKNATLSLRSTGQTYSSADSVINSSIDNGAAEANRTVTITTGSGASQEQIAIAVTNSTTLNDFVTQFNSSADSAVASVINVGTATSADYRISITSRETGLTDGQLALSVGTEVSDPDGNPGTADGSFNNNSLSQATDATLSIAGIGGTITRSSNSIADIIPGLTLNLQSIGTATITIGTDVSETTAKAQTFVNSYNDLIQYISENDLVSREEDGTTVTNTFGTLASTSLDENLIGSLRSAFTTSSLSGGSINTLADLGLATNRDGTLAFNSSTFSDALSSSSDRVGSILSNLGEALGGTAGTIAQFTRFGGLIDSSRNDNTSQITRLNAKIGDLEDSITKREAGLTAQFSRLEATIGKLNSTQQTLSSLLRG